MIQTPQYRQYVADTIALVRSICVKSEQTLTLQNTYLTQLGYDVGEDPRQWKYYLNLNGQYHALDTPVTLISSDTQTEITLTKAILANHPLTAVDYGPGGVFHRDLLEAYPAQRDLILRIFHPIDLDTAIAAPDFAILYYDKQYVHPREQSLMRRIQTWIDNYMARWHIPGFVDTDPLYPCSILATFRQALITAIIGIRWEYEQTNEVAEFLLWSYLGSHYRLDRYRPYLSNRQALWLYRNIRYLRYHVGKEKTMLMLQEHLLKPANITAHRYDAAASEEFLLRDRTPGPLFLESPYAQTKPSLELNSRLSTEQMFGLTDDAGHYNKEDIYDDIDHADQLIRRNKLTTLPTGAVELRVNENPHEVWANPIQIRFQHWFHLCALGRYPTAFTISMGDLGEVNLTAKDSLILFMYAIWKLKDSPEYDTIPDVAVSGAVPLTPPTRDQLTRVLHNDLVRLEFDRLLLEGNLPLPTIRSEVEFELFSESLSRQYFRHYLLSRWPHQSLHQSTVLAAMELVYPKTLCTFPETGMPFEQWISGFDIPVEQFNDEGWQALMGEILRTVVGIDLDLFGISKRHQALVDIMKLLTSYGIIFVDGGRLVPEQPIDLFFLNPVDYNLRIKDKRYLEMSWRGMGTQAKVSNRHTNLPGGLQYRHARYQQQHSRLSVGTQMRAQCTNMQHHFLDSGLSSGKTYTLIHEDT